MFTLPDPLSSSAQILVADGVAFHSRSQFYLNSHGTHLKQNLTLLLKINTDIIRPHNEWHKIRPNFNLGLVSE